MLFKVYSFLFIRKADKKFDISKEINPIKNEQDLSIQINLRGNKKNVKLSEKLIKQVINPIESWTTHGLPNVIRSRHISLKIIWAILFLAALGVSIYFLYKTFTEYFQFNVTTEVRLINVDELEFPVITICEKNQISSEYGFLYFLRKYFETQDYILNDDLTEFFHAVNSNIFPYQILYNIPIEERINFTHSFNDELMSVTLNDQELNSSHFKWIFNPFYGNCYQLNLDSNLKAVTQNDNVLKMLFYLKAPDCFESIKLEKGIRVLISDSNSNSFIQFDDTIYAPSEHETKIRLDKSLFNKYPNPYSDCDFLTDENGNYQYPKNFPLKYFDQIKNAGYPYSQSLCISFCQIDKLGNNCSFRASSIKAPNNLIALCPTEIDSFFDRSSSFNISLFISLLDYYSNDMYKKFFKNNEINQICKRLCPLECKKVNFQFNTLTVNLNRDFIPGFVENPDINDYVGLSINYRSLSYLNYEETPSISVYNLVSNIGGVIGLLLGMSLLSVIELLEFLILSIFITIAHRYKKHKENSYIKNKIHNV